MLFLAPVVPVLSPLTSVLSFVKYLNAGQIITSPELTAVSVVSCVFRNLNADQGRAQHRVGPGAPGGSRRWCLRSVIWTSYPQTLRPLIHALLFPCAIAMLRATSLSRSSR
ncbi:hypothetical protein DFH07DRAFT_840815 [Mycena maculata]|uniref:Uncharacterized protein n=1 Tax=Mycena maculata TaxID=230809 RepID=A0AAD7IC54_9AGAR|nr:hypothetical protein DFH07DRAFT_840815 [Mycena maculata]